MAVQKGQRPVELTVEQQGLADFAKALKAEADGKQLRKDLSKQLKAALDPIKEQAKSNLLGIASAGLTRGQPLRQTVANQLKAEARLSSRNAGARLRVRRKGMPRGFTNAPKALNNPQGWRRQVFSSGVFVQQIAVPTEWFDRAARDGRKGAQAAAMEAVDQMRQRIIKRAR